MNKIYKKFLISIFMGFLAFLIILIITRDLEYSRICGLLATNFHFLATRIDNLEQKIKKLERLLGWDIK